MKYIECTVTVTGWNCAHILEDPGADSGGGGEAGERKTTYYFFAECFHFRPFRLSGEPPLSVPWVSDYDIVVNVTMQSLLETWDVIERRKVLK